MRIILISPLYDTNYYSKYYVFIVLLGMILLFFALNIAFVFISSWPLQYLRRMYIFYGSLLSLHSASCRNTAVNVTDSSTINWYVSFKKLLQDDLKDILFRCCVYMQMHLFFMVYRELIFWVNRRDPLWAIQVSDSNFNGCAHKSNSTAMHNAALSVHIT